MTRYFKLIDNMMIHGRWHVGEITTPDGKAPSLWSGKTSDESLWLEATVSHTGRVLEFSLTSFNVPLATGELASAVKLAAGNDVQCLPVQISNQFGVVVLNSRRMIKCIDDSRSEYIKWTAKDHRADLAGQYRQVTRLVLLPGAVPNDAHFFRVEGWRVALVVSEKVKEAMEQAGCFGAEFIELFE